MKDRRMFPALRLLLFLAALGTAACGYRFTPEGGALPGGVRTLFVPLFQNDTPEPGLEAWFTEAMRETLARAGREGGEASDARLLGTLVELRTPTAIYTTDGEGVYVRTSVSVEVTVDLKLMRGEEQLRRVRVTGQEDYLSTRAAGSPAVLEDDAARRLAIRRLATRLMREGFERLQTF